MSSNIVRWSELFLGKHFFFPYQSSACIKGHCWNWLKMRSKLSQYFQVPRVENDYSSGICCVDCIHCLGIIRKRISGSISAWIIWNCVLHGGGRRGWRWWSIHISACNDIVAAAIIVTAASAGVGAVVDYICQLFDSQISQVIYSGGYYWNPKQGKPWSKGNRSRSSNRKSKWAFIIFVVESPATFFFRNHPYLQCRFEF